MTDRWAGLADQYLAAVDTSVKGRVRVHVVHQQLLDHLAPPPGAIVVVGGGAGSQSIPLARLGYDVTIVDPSAEMLARAHGYLEREDAAVRARVRLVGATGQQAPEVLAGQRFAGVLCLGVLMYVDEPEPFVGNLCALAESGGVVSIVAQNAHTMAVRPALEGRWADALVAFDAQGEESSVLGLRTRADRREDVAGYLAAHGVHPEAWYGVWLFTDGWTKNLPADLDDVLAVELAASRRDPYRQLSRLFHLIGRKA